MSEASSKVATAEVAAQLVGHEARQRVAGGGVGQARLEGGEVLPQDAVEHFLVQRLRRKRPNNGTAKSKQTP